MERNFKKMRWPCKSCMLSDDPSRNQHFMKPFQDFGVRRPSDFVERLLPQGAWTRCMSCQDEIRGELGKEAGEDANNASQAKRRRCGNVGSEYGGKDSGELGKDHGKLDKDHSKLGKEFGKLGGKLGGNTNNALNERRLAAGQACEKCEQCGRSLTAAHFWPLDWRHRMSKDGRMKCKECCPKPPKERLSGYMAGNEQRSIEAAAKPITCQACKRDLPRTQFRPNSSRGTFDFRKPLTCEQCRAEGKHPKSGPKRRRPT